MFVFGILYQKQLDFEICSKTLYRQVLTAKHEKSRRPSYFKGGLLCFYEPTTKGEMP